MRIKYPTLVGEIAKRGLTKREVAARAGINERTFRDKLAGRTSFTWSEVTAIQKNCFPDIELSALFEEAPIRQAT